MENKITNGLQKETGINLNIGTYNIRNVTDRYEERKEALKETIEKMDCDILGLQEVSFDIKNDQTVFLNQDSKYIVLKAPLQIPFKHSNPNAPKCFNIDGNAVFVKKSFYDEYIDSYESKVLHLNPYRNVHLVRFTMKNKKEFIFINTHLHHVIQDSHIRKEQINQIFIWLSILYPSNTDLIIFVGDFNMGLVEVENYNLFMEKGYYSAFKKINGEEPKKTFPTGIKCETMDTDPDLTTDYIFIFDCNNHVKHEHVTIFGDKCVNEDNTLYPSDHYAIVVKSLVLLY